MAAGAAVAESADRTPDSPAAGAAVFAAAATEADVFDEAGVPSEQEPGWSVKMSAAAAAGIVQTKRFLTRMLPDSSKEEVGAGEAAEDAEDESDEPHPPAAAFAAVAAEQAYTPAYEQEALPEEEPDWSGRSKSAPPPLPDIEPYTAPAPATGKRARLFVLVALLDPDPRACDGGRGLLD